MTELYALVEGPRWADTKFYAKWLFAAADAHELWTKALSDPNFSKRIDRLRVDIVWDFNIVATVLISRLEQNLASLVVSLNEEYSEAFAMMVGMGFFVLTGDRYQMVIPPPLTLETVKNAALKLADTEDENFELHPESIVSMMPDANAKEWQSHLRRMDEALRQPHRVSLLKMAGVEISP